MSIAITKKRKCKNDRVYLFYSLQYMWTLITEWMSAQLPLCVLLFIPPNVPRAYKQIKKVEMINVCVSKVTVKRVRKREISTQTSQILTENRNFCDKSCKNTYLGPCTCEDRCVQSVAPVRLASGSVERQRYIHQSSLIDQLLKQVRARSRLRKLS